MPHVDVDQEKRDIENLLQQLQSPFLLLGDMNVRSPVWGVVGVYGPNPRGRMLQDLLLNHPISILNNEQPTHYHIQTGTYSVIDLSICSSDCLPDFTYAVSDSLCGSDHYPIHIGLSVEATCIPERPDLYDTNRADWGPFHTLTWTEASVETFHTVEELVDFIRTHFIAAANEAIVKKPTRYRKTPMPWWNFNLFTLVGAQKRAERAHRRHNTVETKIAYNRAKARCRYYINKARRESWQ